MDKNTFIERIKDIGSTEDVTERLSKLTSLSDEMNEVFDSVDNLNTQITSFTEKETEYKDHIDRLQKFNMDLYKRLGVEQTPAQQKASTGIKEPEEAKIEFDDIFKK
jgi:uncharacterized protein YoxC